MATCSKKMADIIQLLGRDVHLLDLARSLVLQNIAVDLNFTLVEGVLALRLNRLGQFVGHISGGRPTGR